MVEGFELQRLETMNHILGDLPLKVWGREGRAQADSEQAARAWMGGQSVAEKRQEPTDLARERVERTVTGGCSLRPRDPPDRHHGTCSSRQVSQPSSPARMHYSPDKTCPVTTNQAQQQHTAQGHKTPRPEKATPSRRAEPPFVEANDAAATPAEENKQERESASVREAGVLIAWTRRPRPPAPTACAGPRTSTAAGPPSGPRWSPTRASAGSSR